MRMKYGCKGYELSYLLIQFFILKTRAWTQFVQSLRLARICVDDIYIREEWKICPRHRFQLFFKFEYILLLKYMTTLDFTGKT
jgi:hypothetical protein